MLGRNFVRCFREVGWRLFVRCIAVGYVDPPFIEFIVFFSPVYVSLGESAPTAPVALRPVVDIVAWLRKMGVCPPHFVPESDDAR